MSFTYERTIRLADTDAAGVVFFARTLALCHEAYEAALDAAGYSIAGLLGQESDSLIPIARASADYLRPLFCGDLVRITLRPTRLSEDSFAIDYELVRVGSKGTRSTVAASARARVAARARTEHVVIGSQAFLPTAGPERARRPIPEKLAAWVDAG